MVQRGTVVFLVLMICSALMIGTTLGIISMREYLIPNLAAVSSSSQVTDHSTASESTGIPSAPVPESSNNKENESMTHPSPSRHKEPETSSSMRLNDGSASAKLLLLTETEVREIKSMLRDLGYETSSLSEAVKQFQEKNHLMATGYLDTDTLTSIMSQVLRQKVAKLNT